MELISTLQGNPLWFLTPKLGFELRENIHVGAGSVILGLPEDGIAGLAYGTITYGSDHSNLSFGLGVGMAEGILYDSPTFSLSGQHRVANKLSIISENYFLPNDLAGDSYFGIHGIRLLSGKSSFDIGLLVIPSIAKFILGIPVVGYQRRF